MYEQAAWRTPPARNGAQRQLQVAMHIADNRIVRAMSCHHVVAFRQLLARESHASPVLRCPVSESRNTIASMPNGRRVVNLLAGISLLLCVTTAGLWIRSRSFNDWREITYVFGTPR